LSGDKNERTTLGLLLWRGDEQNFGNVQASAAVPALRTLFGYISYHQHQ
jgi:hypothetical protein